MQNNCASAEKYFNADDPCSCERNNITMVYVALLYGYYYIFFSFTLFLGTYTHHVQFSSIAYVYLQLHS